MRQKREFTFEKFIPLVQTRKTMGDLELPINTLFRKYLIFKPFLTK